MYLLGERSSERLDGLGPAIFFAAELVDQGRGALELELAQLDLLLQRVFFSHLLGVPEIRQIEA